MRDFLELTKPRITVLILICTAVGYSFGCRTSFRLLLLVHVLLGTALMASGTSALNQWYEVDSDAKMRRTRERPIPERIRPEPKRARRASGSGATTGGPSPPAFHRRICDCGGVNTSRRASAVAKRLGGTVAILVLFQLSLGSADIVLRTPILLQLHLLAAVDCFCPASGRTSAAGAFGCLRRIEVHSNKNS